MKRTVIATGLLVVGIASAFAQAELRPEDRRGGRGVPPRPGKPEVARPQPPVVRPVAPVAPVVRPQPRVERPVPPVFRPQPRVERPVPPVFRPKPRVERPEPPVFRPQPRVERPEPDRRPRYRPEIAFAPLPSLPVWRRDYHPYEVRYHDTCQRKAWRLRWFERRARADGVLTFWERTEIRSLKRDLRRSCGDYRWRD